MPIGTKETEVDYIVSRLKNQFGAAEGKTIPPLLQNGVRVPIVSNFRVIQSKSYTGGTQFTLAWDSPSLSSNISISYYLISVKGIASGTADVVMAPVAVEKSPAIIKVQGSVKSRGIIAIQTVLTSGQLSGIDNSPTVVVEIDDPVITTSDIPSLENVVLGGDTLTSVNGITYVTGTSTIGEDPTNLYYDATNKRVGLLTNTPKSTIDDRGSLGLSYSSQNSNFTAGNIFWYDVDTGSGNITVTLPSASGVGSRFYLFRKSTSDTNTVTVGSVFTLSYQKETILIASDGTNFIPLIHSIL